MDDQDYTVGYQRPPTATQFQKGQSGNPKGRPPKKPSEEIGMQDALIDAVAAYIDVVVDGEQMSLPKIDVICMKIASKALQGDMHAIKVLTEYLPVQSDVMRQRHKYRRKD